MRSSIAHLLKLRAVLAGNSHKGHEWAGNDPVVGFLAPALWYLYPEDRKTSGDEPAPGEDIFWGNSARFTYMRYRLGKVIEGFRDAGIPVIVIKGALLAESLYLSPGLRYMSDMDLLVQNRDFRAAVQIMKETGWEERRSCDSDNLLDTIGDPDFEADWQMGEGVFFNSKGCVIDLHWHLAPYVWPRRLFRVNSDAIWREAVLLDAPNLPGAYSLSQVHTLAYMCLHLAEHGLKQLRWLLDVDLFVRKYCDLPDWSWRNLVICAADWRIQSAVFHALSFSRFLFGTAVPDHVLEDLDPGPAPRARLRVLLRPVDLLVHPPRAPGMSHPRLVSVALVDRVSDLIRFLARLLVPDDAWRRKRYGDDATLLHHWGRVLRAVEED
jgi:hypothetical protein